MCKVVQSLESYANEVELDRYVDEYRRAVAMLISLHQLAKDLAPPTSVTSARLRAAAKHSTRLALHSPNAERQSA